MVKEVRHLGRVDIHAVYDDLVVGRFGMCGDGCAKACNSWNVRLRL